MPIANTEKILSKIINIKTKQRMRKRKYANIILNIFNTCESRRRIILCEHFFLVRQLKRKKLCIEIENYEIIQQFKSKGGKKVCHAFRWNQA